MPRVNFVKKAAKDYPEAGIKKGEEYYHWKFRFGPMVRSKEHPKPWQLTRSEFYSTLYQIQDAIGNIKAEDVEDLQQQVQDLAGQIRELGEECQEKHDNMPDSLQDSETGELLTSRAEAMESAADELEGIDFDAPDEGDLVEEVKEEMREELEAENKLLDEDPNAISDELSEEDPEFDGKSDEDKHHLIDVEIAHRKDANEQVWKGLEEEIGQQVSDKMQERLQEIINEVQNVSLDAE
jgi:hypothetical protein